MEEDCKTKKTHREKHSGRKVDKKKAKKGRENSIGEVPDKQRNPKAFAFNSAVRAERRFRRKEDLDTKKQHVPVVDRTPVEPPPIIIAVVGPPKVGKSTLINNLIKLFTKLPLTDIKGPVTIVIGKKRRVTFIECNNDINCMIDLAKVADLVLLLCDASFGFEMEVFEFLNICQVHGMPKIMGILTHLDMIKNNKTLKMTKKTLKHRFWTEVYPGAKLFYLSGILHGEYLRNEIKNLGRFISIMKFRPLQWRSTHSYLLSDRYEDLTNQELIRKNPKCDRTISLYGYVRGVSLNKESSVHIAGLGDLKIYDISYLPDPCPLPEQLKKRALIEKEKFIYAPFSGVGGIVYDKDAVYVELGGSHSHNKQSNDESSNIISNIIEAKETLDEKMRYSELQIFTEGEKITANDLDESEYEINKTQQKRGKESLEDKNNELDSKIKLQEYEEHHTSGFVRRRVLFDTTDEKLEEDINHFDVNNDSKVLNEYVDLKNNKDIAIHSKISNILNELNKTKKRQTLLHNTEDVSSSSESSEEEGIDDYDTEEENSNSDELKWKNNMLQRGNQSFLERQSSKKNLMKLVYGVFNNKYLAVEKKIDNEDSGDEIGGLFKKVTKEQEIVKMDKDNMNLLDSSLIMAWNSPVENWLAVQNRNLISKCFVTGKWKESEDANELLKLDDAEDLSDEDSDIFGDFEDLETGEKHSTKIQNEKQSGKRKREENKDDKVDLAEKKRKLKEKFDTEYDNIEKTSFYGELKTSAENQAQLNKTVFENMPDDVRVQIEGYRPGMYVRIEFQNVASEFVENFDPTYPLVIGALNLGEENIGYVNVKIKKHRWYNKILKANDPLIISLGWRRFQTIPLYAKLEDDLKLRYLKYSPEHLSCTACFWGPITPQGTGFLALQVVNSQQEVIKKLGFRIAATGSVQELDKSTNILKKLKLIGYPMKIYKKTAFIKGMFNSALEVAKFEGARIKTVSGIRGQIKKAISKPDGCFRATFEDKIQLSDIIFCRTWYKVDVTKFYTPVTTLLLPQDKKNSWKGMRATGEIKRDKGIKNFVNQDHLYTPVQRVPKPFKPLVIPKKLQQALPYRDKPKHGVKLSDAKKSINRVAVIREPYEQKVTTMMKMLRASYDQKQEKLKKETKERLEKHRQEIAAIETNKSRKLQQIKKDVFRNKSKSQNREQKTSESH